MSELLSLLWVLVPCGFGYAGFLTWLNRMHPRHPPLPSAEDLRVELADHKREVEQALDNLRGKIDMRTGRPGTRS